jgi:predicted ATPase
MVRLTSITVSGYRSLYNISLNLHDLTILIGRNDAGKSNVLRAIQLLLDDTQIDHIEKDDFSKIGKSNRYVRKMEIKAQVEGFSFTEIRRSIPNQPSGTRYPTLLEVNEPQSGWRQPTQAERDQLPVFYYLQPRTGALQEEMKENAQKPQQSQQNSQKENALTILVKQWLPKELQGQNKLDSFMRLYARNRNPLGSYYTFLKNEVYASIPEAFPIDFPVMELNPEFRNSSIRHQLLVRELDSAGKKRAFLRLPIDHHGSGIVSVMAIILTVAILREYHRLSLSNRSFLLAIEEPEVHLNPRAQRTLLSFFKQTRTVHQVLVATHSPIFVDRTEPESVVMLQRTTPKSTLTAASVLGATTTIANVYSNNWREVCETLGVQLSDVLMAGEICLVVEGQSEMVLVPAILQHIDPYMERSRIVILHGQGSNLPKIVEFLQYLGTKIVAVVDFDHGGRGIKDKLDKLAQPVDALFILDTVIVSLPPPMNKLFNCELEDLFNSYELLEVYNKAVVITHSLPEITVAEFDSAQDSLVLAGNTEFGWVQTVGTIMQQRTGARGKPSESVEKHKLALGAADALRNGKLQVPQFFFDVAAKLNSLL